jgi:hypothetical protein
MKKIAFLILLFALGIRGNAQLPVPTDEEKAAEDGKVFKKNIDYSFSMGTSFFSSHYGKGSLFYVAPGFNLKLSPKFQMDAGIIFSQNNISYSAPVGLSGTSVVVNQNPVRESTVYASGIYMLNPKLTFTGSLVKTFPDNNENSYWDNSFQMMSVGLKYKITGNITFGASMNMVQGNIYNPYTGYSIPGASVDPWGLYSAGAF